MNSKIHLQELLAVKCELHVNKTIGSQGASQFSEAPCAFRTGNWQSNTDLRVLVGNEGKIYGRGGDGGRGGMEKVAAAKLVVMEHPLLVFSILTEQLL